MLRKGVCLLIYIMLDMLWKFLFVYGYILLFLNFCMQPPKASDRAQVQSKEVRLPDSGPIPLDDQDVQIVSSYAFTVTLF